MKRFLLFILTISLSSCYLANGSPNSFIYWVKNNKKISFVDVKKCSKLSKKYVLNNKNKWELYNELRNKFNEDPIKMINFNKEEYKQYENLVYKLEKNKNKCYYDLGYRFQAPLYWCLAQDGDNTKICIENMKYRN